MIRISQIKLPVNHTKEALTEAVIKKLKECHKKIPVHFDKTSLSFQILKQSVDARKGTVYYSYTVMLDLKDILSQAGMSEEIWIKKCNHTDFTFFSPVSYEKSVLSLSVNEFPGRAILSNKPVIIGSGPAGLFCAYTLAKSGYQPIVIERGEPVEERTKTVKRFFDTGILNPESNVQFGEGGAGTFSDGKLNTMVKDRTGRNTFVLETFVRFGADEKILYVNKPHIGTDVLSVVVKNMREEIKRLGGSFYFHTRFEGIKTENGRRTAIKLVDTLQHSTKELACDVLVLATGHSARDTFEMLYREHLLMEPKAFAMGVRIEHPHKMIDKAQYGMAHELLPAADYKFTHQSKNGRGVYTFCMCPGGYVVNASSEEEKLCVNGMSYSGRDGHNSNSAVIVTVDKNDFPDPTPLGGIRLQRNLEKTAYQLGGGRIPVQLWGDFKNHQISSGFGDILPQTKGGFAFADLRLLFPEALSEALMDGIQAFDQKLKGFSRYDAVLSGIESRTSSPLRIIRNENFESSVSGLYPCGEGAGYAGGITSAAMDGLRIFEAIRRKYEPLTE